MRDSVSIDLHDLAHIGAANQVHIDRDSLTSLWTVRSGVAKRQTAALCCNDVGLQRAALRPSTGPHLSDALRVLEGCSMGASPEVEGADNLRVLQLLQ